MARRELRSAPTRRSPFAVRKSEHPPNHLNLSALKKSGHFPTLVTAFLYFDYSFMVWTLLGALAVQIAAPEALGLSAQQKGFMVALPILSDACLRILVGLFSDRLGSKNTGILAQSIVIAGLACAWIFGLKSYAAVLLLGAVLGFAGASFAIALPQVGRWYPPHMQGLVLGLAGAGNIGVVLDAILAPRLAAAYGWQNVFGLAVLPALAVLVAYIIFSKQAPVQITPRKFSDYVRLFREKDTHWFCFLYTVSFGGFVGLASSLVLYFNSEFGLPAVQAGGFAALCAGAGALARPIGGGLADRIGGIRSLYYFYGTAGMALLAAGLVHRLPVNCAIFLVASAAFGMANGAVFQLLPQRFGNELGVMTGLVGSGGSLGGFVLATLMGLSTQYFRSPAISLWFFSALCLVALAGLGLVKTRWRTTWGALAAARI